MSDDRAFARERCHQDAKVATGLARAAAWAAVLLNGGGAAAVLAHGGRFAHGAGAPLLTTAPYAFALYALGAFFGALKLFRLFEWIEQWNVYWEAMARELGVERLEAAHAKASRIAPRIEYCFYLSMALFLVASATLTMGLLRSVGSAP